MLPARILTRIPKENISKKWFLSNIRVDRTVWENVCRSNLALSESINGTKLWKSVVSVNHIINQIENETDNLARHCGALWSWPQLTVDNGKASRFIGRKLDEIELSSYLLHFHYFIIFIFSEYFTYKQYAH